MYQVFEFIDGQFKQPVETFVSDGTSNIAEWITGPLTAAVTLYIVLYGYLVLRGSVSEPVLELSSGQSSSPLSSCSSKTLASTKSMSPMFSSISCHAKSRRL